MQATPKAAPTASAMRVPLEPSSREMVTTVMPTSFVPVKCTHEITCVYGAAEPPRQPCFRVRGASLLLDYNRIVQRRIRGDDAAIRHLVAVAPPARGLRQEIAAQDLLILPALRFSGVEIPGLIDQLL